MSIKRTGILKLACWTLALLLAGGPLASRASALTVYYAKDNRIYREALARDTTLETTAFANAAILDAAWTTAYLSGQEPDVLLLDEKSELPIWRLVQVQAFYDLTDLWQEDPYYNPNDYFANVMTAGSLDGRQYFLPFCFQLTHAFTTQERMDLYDMKFDARETNMQDALDLLWRHLEDMMGEQEAAALVWNISRSDAPMQMMEFCGLPVVDYGQSEIVVDKNALFEISTMIRNVYENSAQLEHVIRKYYNNVIGVLEHVSLMIEDAPWPFNLRFYNTGYGSGLWEEPACFVFPDWTKPGTYHAQVTHYGAVSANASDPQAGYELLRALQDEDISDTAFNKSMADSVYEMSVSREVMDRTLDNLENQEGGYLMLGGKRTVVEPLPDWYGEQIETVLNSIADAVLPDRAVGAILMECLEPYYGMQDDFDACYDELVDRLTLFLEEAPLVEAER